MENLHKKQFIINCNAIIRSLEIIINQYKITLHALENNHINYKQIDESIMLDTLSLRFNQLTQQITTIKNKKKVFTDNINSHELFHEPGKFNSKTMGKSRNEEAPLLCTQGQSSEYLMIATTTIHNESIKIADLINKLHQKNASNTSSQTA